MLEVSWLALLLLGGVGMTAIIVESEIALFFKNILEKFVPKFIINALNCYQCTGFWSGLTLSFVFMNPFEVSYTFPYLMLELGKNFAAACATSLLSVLWASIMLLIESKTVISNGKSE